MGYARRQHFSNHSTRWWEEHEGPIGRKPRVPRNYLQEVLSDAMDGASGPTVKEFINHKYDNVDRKLPVYFVQNNLFNRIARADFSYMLECDDIDVTLKVRELMIMRAIPGHANSGHGRFAKKARFVNANPEWVFHALHKDAKKMRTRCQDVIDPIQEHADMIIRNPYDPKVKHAVDRKGDPLSGAHIIAAASGTDPIARLIGMYLGSRMDSYEWRSRVRQRFGLEMGGGKSYALDTDHMLNEKVTLEDLSTREHIAEDIAGLIAKGIIIDKPMVKAGRNIINGYVRIKRGYGVSDDAAMITAGLLHGPEASLGLLLVDSVDTWDKSTPCIYQGGQDELLGDFILQRCEEKGIELPSDRQVEEFIYLSAINPMRVTMYPDCSQRRFHLHPDDDKNSTQWSAASLHLELVRKIRREKFVEYAAALVSEKLQYGCPEERELGIADPVAQKEPMLDMSTIKTGSNISNLPLLHISFLGVPSNSFYNTYLARWNKTHNDGLLSQEIIPRSSVAGHEE